MTSLSLKPEKRGSPSPRGAIALCLTACAVGVGAFAWQTGPVQELRLRNLDLPTLSRLATHGSSDPRLLYYLGRRLNDAGRFAEADPLLRQAVNLEPETPRLRDEWTRALLGSGLVTAAFGQLQQYAGAHPNEPEAHLLLGKFYVTQNSMARAQEELSRAIALKPDLGEAWSNLAVAQNAQQSLGQAIKSAEKAVSLRPNSADDWLLLAGLRSRTQAPESDVRTAFETATRLAPQSAAPRREWARYLTNTGKNPQEAEGAARAALARDGRDAGALYVLGRALQQREHWEEAATNLTEAANRARWDTAPVAALVQVLQAQKKMDDAQSWQKQLQDRQEHNARRDGLIVRVQERPEDRASHLALAKLWAAEGDIARCVRQHSQALHLALDAPRVLSSAARDLAEADFTDDAVPLARRAVEVSPNSPDAHEALGAVLVQAGQIREGAAEWDKASGWWPERNAGYQARLSAAIQRQKALAALPQGPGAQSFIRAKQMLSAELSSTRFPQQARTLAEEAVKQDPTNVTYLRFLLTVQLRQKDENSARATAARLVTLTPDDPKACAVWAVLLAKNDADANSLTQAQAQIARADALLEKTANGKAVEEGATLHYARGLIALRQRQAAAAVQELARAIVLDPEPDEPVYKLAQAYRLAGQAAKAETAEAEFARRRRAKQEEVDALERLALHPETAALYEAAARVFRAHGKAAEAQAILASQAAQINPSGKSALSTNKALTQQRPKAVEKEQSK